MSGAAHTSRILLGSFLLFAAGCLLQSVPESRLQVALRSGPPEEAVGPFPSWANAKSAYGAKGDGISDDTMALQAAFQEIGEGQHPDVLYLPAGTYLISSTLTLRYKAHISIIGQDPDQTIIQWTGPAGGTMLLVNGVTQSRWGRITWDGAGRAATGVAHQWDAKGGFAPTNLEHADEVFRNLGTGIIGGGGAGMNDDSVTIARCRFLSCSRAGVSVESPNALNYWIWDSQFTDNARGVTNEFGRGNFLVYRSLFRNSSVADITIYGTQYFSFRGNTSIGSRQFFHAIDAGQNAAPITLQENRILDTLNPVAIEVGNLGLLLLLDNEIRSRPGVGGPAVRMATWAQGGDLISAGNVYTVANPIAVQTSSARWWTQDDQVTERSDISGSLPTLPGTLSLLNRAVFELRPGVSAADIQQAVDRAAELAGQRPIVHLAKGNYALDQSVSIPANTDVQIVGDGYGTLLSWKGPAGGVMFHLDGPARATFRELALFAENATAIQIENPDQPRSRVHAEGLFQEFARQNNVLSERLQHTAINLQSHQMGHVAGVSVKAVGTGGSGTSRIAIFGATTGADGVGGNPLYEITDGGRIMVEDAWYEGGSSRLIYATDTGTFTANGMHVAPTSEAPLEPILNLSGFSGQFAFVGVDFDFHGLDRRVQVSSERNGGSAFFLGLNFDGRESFARLSPTGNLYFAHNKRCGPPQPPAVNAGCYQVPDQGDQRSIPLVRSMLDPLRKTRPAIPLGLPRGTTDVRLYRLNIARPDIGIHLRPAPAGGSPSASKKSRGNSSAGSR